MPTGDTPHTDSCSPAHSESTDGREKCCWFLLDATCRHTASAIVSRDSDTMWLMEYQIVGIVCIGFQIEQKKTQTKKNCVSLLWRGWRCIWRLCDDGDGPMLVYQPWLWNGSLWNLAAWSESRCLHWRRVIKKRGICGEFVREFFCLRWSLDYMIWQTKFWRWFCLRYSQICWMHAL